MHIFYNEAFDFRIAIQVDNFHQACEILRDYLHGKKCGSHELEVADFKHEVVDIIL